MRKIEASPAPSRFSEPGSSRAGAPAAWWQSDLLVAFGLAAVCTTAYLATFAKHFYWSDGRAIVAGANLGAWVSEKLLYFPLYHLVHAIVAPLGGSTAASLHALSLGSTALAVAFGYLVSRELGCGRLPAAAGALLFAFAPTIWFFAVAIEVHPPHLLAGAFATWWLVRAHRRGTLGASALPFAGLFWLLAGTHPTGTFWGPGLALVFLIAARGRLRGRRVATACALCAAFAPVWYWATPEFYFQGFVAESPLGPFRPRLLWEDVVIGGGLLVPLAAAGLVRSTRAGLARLQLAPIGVLLVLYFAYFPCMPVFERGAYYHSLYPLFALGCAVLFDGASRALPVAGLLVVVQASFAVAYVASYREEARPPEWVPDLVEETGGRCIVLLSRSEELLPILQRSPLVALHLGKRLIRLGPENLVGLAHGASAEELLRGRSQGEGESELESGLVSLEEFVSGSPEPGAGRMPIAFRAELAERGTNDQRAYLSGLAELLGEPSAGGNPAYRIYP